VFPPILVSVARERELQELTCGKMVIAYCTGIFTPNEAVKSTWYAAIVVLKYWSS
jgi:hypothetical protein